MTEHEEYLKRLEEKKYKEDYVKRKQLIEVWKSNPERFSRQILFQTEPDELKMILEELKLVNPSGYDYLMDFGIVHSFLTKPEREIVSLIKARSFENRLDYFLIILEREIEKDFRNAMAPLMKGLNKEKDKVVIAGLTKEVFEKQKSTGWFRLRRIFHSFKSELDNNQNVIEFINPEFSFVERIRIENEEKRKISREEVSQRLNNKNQSPTNLGVFENIVDKRDTFIEFERKLITAGYFLAKDKGKLYLNKDTLDLAAWVVILVKKKIVKHIPKKSKSDSSFNYSKFVDDFIKERYEGFKETTLKNKISPSRHASFQKNKNAINQILES